jgi:geranylgeranyl diphosphate synthase type II
MTKKSNLTHNQRLVEIAETVEQAMEGYLSHDPGVPETLHKAMLYSLRAGGKRLRPALVILTCQACGSEEVIALPAAAAIEMVHTYSLIHDDLPAMDDDDWRRGRPSNHKVFGDGIAILAGDALLTYAFNTLSRHVQKDSLVKELVFELSQAAGAAGMIGGQVEDLIHQNISGELEKVSYIHIYKTAMMFRAAARMGAICADAEKTRVDRLGDFGLKIGLAFQIVDDILDITSTTKELGKTAQKDSQAGKLTYPAVMGLDQSREHAEKLIAEAIEVLEELGDPAEPLRDLARMLLKRNN